MDNERHSHSESMKSFLGVVHKLQRLVFSEVLKDARVDVEPSGAFNANCIAHKRVEYTALRPGQAELESRLFDRTFLDWPAFAARAVL